MKQSSVEGNCSKEVSFELEVSMELTEKMSPREKETKTEISNGNCIIAEGVDIEMKNSSSDPCSDQTISKEEEKSDPLVLKKLLIKERPDPICVSSSSPSTSCNTTYVDASHHSTVKGVYNGYHKPPFPNHQYPRNYHRCRDLKPRRSVSKSPHRYNYWAAESYDFDAYSDDEYYNSYGSHDYGGDRFFSGRNYHHTRYNFPKNNFNGFNKHNGYYSYNPNGRGRYKGNREAHSWFNYNRLSPGHQNNNYFNDDHSYKKANCSPNRYPRGAYQSRGRERTHSGSSLSPRTTKNNIRNQNYKFKSAPSSSPNPSTWGRHSPLPNPSHYYSEDLFSNGLTVDVGGELGNLEECAIMTSFCGLDIEDGLLTMGGNDVIDDGDKKSENQDLKEDFLGFVDCDNTKDLESKEGGHVVHFHINPGTTVNFTNSEGEIQKISGPATVRMVSTNSSPPIPLPVQMPPGHVVQQIVDETGTLQHVILSAQPMPLPVCSYGPNAGQGPPQFYNAPPPGPPQGYMTSYQPAPQYSPVMSPPLTSPPPHNYQKSDRNGGREKMRKFYHRHQGMQHFQQPPPVHLKNNLNNIHHNSPPLSPKKDNSIPRKPGEEHVNGEVAEVPSISLQELLSQIKPPEISSIEVFQACVHWSPPDLSYLDEKDVSALLYEVFLNNHLYDTVSNTSIEIVNLRPGVEYKINLICMCNGIRGFKTPAKSFCTKSTVPDPPLPARLTDRKKQSLSFRWNAPKDNGSRITGYCVEIMGAQWTSWTPIQNSRNRDFSINKLRPQTTYRIRVAASNEIGISDFSKETVATTVGLAPSIPLPPNLSSCTINSLTLSWTQRPEDENFSLEMEDSINDYGFRPIFHGSETSYTCHNLRRNADYKFRLFCQNVNGKSPFSEIVSYRTLPDRPQPPPAPCMKGNPLPEKLTLNWSPPNDHGGAQITSYDVEIDRGNGFENVYSGAKLMCDVRDLTPGTNYQVRVCASSSGGKSKFSEIRTVTTKPVEPGQCKPPRLSGKPKANSLQLKWGQPSFDGGSMITEYELEMITPNSERKRVYSGRDTECAVASLLPGRPYMFLLRAVNKEGTGSWSEPLEVVSGAGPPDPCKAPRLACKTSYSVLVSWEEPINNGARVENYTVEIAEVSSPNTESSESSSTSGDMDGELTFTEVYSGPAISAEVRNLTPANSYAFRISASNVAGPGPYSALSTVTTPAASPGIVTHVSSSNDGTDVILCWTEPSSHGDPITHYNIEVGDRIITTDGPVLEHTITDLLPETTYKIRVQAVNSVGSSAFSTSHRVTTQPLPPSPPTIELVKASYSSLRLKWGDGRNLDLLKYSLLMEFTNPHNNSKEFYQLYKGTNQTFKVIKLEENSTYRFSICATNEAGVGPTSTPVEFRTIKAPPLPIKAPRVKEGPDGTYCIEWTGLRCPGEDTMVYRLQMLQSAKDQDYSLIYVGSEPSFIKSGLAPNAGYYVRVCGVRKSGEKEVIAGAYSLPTFFNTPKVETPEIAQDIDQSTKETQWGELTDQHKAMAILILFSLLAFVAAYVLSPDSVR